MEKELKERVKEVVQIQIEFLEKGRADIRFDHIRALSFISAFLLAGIIDQKEYDNYWILVHDALEQRLENEKNVNAYD